MVWETFWEWVGRDGAVILPYFFFLVLLFLLPLPSLWPHLFTLLSPPSLHRCDLLGAKLFPLSDLHTELLMQVPHGKLGAIFYLETFQPYTADPATAACFITHHGDVWMEINGFFTLFPRQICPAVGSLGEWARDHWHELLPAPGRGTEYWAGGHFTDYFYSIVTWKTENSNPRPQEW